MKKQIGDFTKFNFNIAPLGTGKTGGYYKKLNNSITMLSPEMFKLWMEQSEDKSNFRFFTSC